MLALHELRGSLTSKRLPSFLHFTSPRRFPSSLLAMEILGIDITRSVNVRFVSVRC
jgi:hypothetical protein